MRPALMRNDAPQRGQTCSPTLIVQAALLGGSRPSGDPREDCSAAHSPAYNMVTGRENYNIANIWKIGA